MITFDDAPGDGKLKISMDEELPAKIKVIGVGAAATQSIA